MGNRPAGGGDLGLSLGSSAASKLLHKALDSQLRSPRFIQIRLNSKDEATVQDVAQIDSQNRVDLGDLQVYFRENQQIEMEAHNMQMNSTALIKDVALPLFFLDQKKLLLHVEIKQAYIRLNIDGPASLRIKECQLEHGDIELKLEHSYLLNLLLNVFRSKLPKDFVRERVCALLLNTAINLRDKFSLQVSFKSLIPDKFTRYLLNDRVNLRSRIQSVNAADEQITVTAVLEWTSDSPQITTLAAEDASTVHIANLFSNSDNTSSNATDGMSEQMEQTKKPLSTINNEPMIRERMLLWVEDRLLNDLLKQFRWDSQWVNESIQLNSPRLPRETRAFFEVICPQCYFLFNISADGLPNVQIAPDNSILIKNRNRIAAAVLNPTLGQSGEKRTAIDLSMSLELKLVPEIQNGTFRTHLYLIERKVEVKNGSAFPSNMNKLVEQLIQDLIAEDIWPVLQHELEPLIYQSGIQLPNRCGLDPRSAQLHFEKSRFGVSARLDLDQVSFGQCFQQFKSGLPDASRLLMFNSLPKGPGAEAV